MTPLTKTQLRRANLLDDFWRKRSQTASGKPRHFLRQWRSQMSRR